MATSANTNSAIDKQIDGRGSQANEHVDEVDTQKPNSTSANDGNDFDFDELLPYVGEFGLYQKLLFVLMIPFSFYVAWVYFTQIFITLVPEDHWCRIPELEQANMSTAQIIALAIPKESGTSRPSRCLMYKTNYTEALLNNITEADRTWATQTCQHGWDYNFTDIPYSTVATENHWVCEDAALPTISQSIFFVGSIFGGLICGWVADRYGRIPALVGANLVGCVAGISTAFSNNFWEFTLCRFFVGFAFDNCFAMMYILVLEYVGLKWRTFVANMSIAIFFTFAACVLPWIAYYLADWRLTVIAVSAPMALAIATPWMVPESARWLVSQGQIDKAIEILKKIEKINGTHVPDNVYKRFKDSCERVRKTEETGRNYSVIDLFRTPRLRKIVILMIVIWMAISLVFDGHVRNIDNLGLNVFITFTIATATELPADTFLTAVLDRWGRRWLACGSMAISGLFSIWACIVSDKLYAASLAILGRFCVNISYNIGLQYAAELLPTVVRAQGVAIIHIMGYLANIIAPFIVYLAIVSPILPLLILGVCGILGGMLALALPETLFQELPQTLQDGEDFGKDQGLWDMPCFMKQPDDEVKPEFIRSRRVGSIMSTGRPSLRGETLRSSMIQRSSVRSRQSAISAPVEVVRL